jgi:dipeptidyl aminopeptidase/acylaminoacyl peptidase
VYVVPSDGSAPPRRYTYGPKKDNHPRWSADGSQLLFVSDRDGKPQVYVMPADGGEARRVTSLENGVGFPAWSPDGRQVAFISTTGIRVDEDIKDIVSYHYTEAYFKDDGEGIKRGRNHVFVQDLDGGDAVQLTDGPDDYRDPVWSPDGSRIAVLCQRADRRAFEWATDIYVLPASGGEARVLTPGDGPSYSPSFSPDGATLAYLGHRNPPETGGSTVVGVWAVPVEGGEPVLLTEGWDRSASHDDVNSDARWGTNEHRPVWSADGSRLLFLATDHGATHVYAVPAAGDEVRAVTGGKRAVYAFSAGRDKLAYLAAELLNPGDLYASALDGSGEVRLTHANEEFLSGFALSEPEEVRFTSTEGAEIQGWVMKPAGYTEGERYPLIIEVHGGPHTAYGYAFFHEFQVLAGRGYGVLYTNPRGSTGYGQEFAVCIVKNWGERDYQDVLAAADWAASQPWVDPDRLGMTGGSYGGFMTNWVVGHTDRFKAAVTRRCVSNWVSFYGTSDIGPRFSEWMVGGTPWDNPEGYARMSPITYVSAMRTPLLVIHSEEDHRCAVEQSEQLFVALKRLGCETEFVRYPQESHSLSRVGKPARRVENLQRVAAWFERYIATSG